MRRILRRDAPAHGLAGRILRLGRRRCGKEQACAPAALILWRRGKDAYPRSKPGAEASPRVHPAVDRESLVAIELTGRLGPSRNGNVLGLTGP